MNAQEAFAVLEDELQGALDPAEWSDELCEAWDTLAAIVAEGVDRG